MKEPAITPASATKRRKYIPPVFAEAEPERFEMYNPDEFIKRVKAEFNPLKAIKYYKAIGFDFSIKEVKADLYEVTLSREDEDKGNLITRSQTFRIPNDLPSNQVESMIIEAKLKFFEP